MGSTLQAVFSPGAMRHLADGRSFERGAAYLDAGRVKNPKLGDEEPTASVRGARQYRVRLWLENGAPAFSCNCPVGEEGLFCKHCVAIGLRLSEADSTVIGRGSKEPTLGLRRHLEGLDKRRLIDLLL